MKKRILTKILALATLMGLFPTESFATQLSENEAPSAPTGLMMELSREPLGVETEYPLLSWVVNDTDQNEVQTAYRVLVATSQDKLVEGEADIWDSGKVISGESTNVPYGGDALPADSIFYWTVKTWDKDDVESPYAQPQFFSTAVKDNWDANAIWYETNAKELFREVGLTDYTLEADFTIAENALGFVVRKSSNSTVEEGYMIQVRIGSGSNQVVKLQQLGSSTNVKTITANQCGVSIEAGKSYHLKISAVGTELKVWIDGTLITTQSDFLQDAYGTFGIRCGNSESGYVENLKVTCADGTPYLQNDFSDSNLSPFANGGAVSDGRLTVDKGQKLYHVVKHRGDPLIWADYTVECDFRIENTALGFIVRKPDLSATTHNGYMVQISIGSGSSTVIKIQQLQVGSLLSKPVTGNACGVSIVAGQTYHLKISAIGTELKVWIDGTPVVNSELRQESPTFLVDEAGTVGVRCGNSESGYVDNYRVIGLDGVVYLASDFTTAEDMIFSTGGTVTDEALYVGKGKKIYHVTQSKWVEEKGDAVFLRKEFTVEKTVEKAIVSAIGKSRAETLQYVFKMYVNGSFAGLGSPRSLAATDNAKYNVYNTFDVTDLICQGENCIGVTAYTTSDKRIQARLKLFYTDGTTEVINTDDTWVAMDGTKAFGDVGGSVGSAIYALVQENIDARVYPFGYSEPGFDDSNWEPVTVKTTITDLFASQVENTEEFVMPAQKVVDKGDGNYFIQLEKGIVGGIRLRIPEGTAGTQLTILYGEELESENTVKWQMRTGNNYQEIWTLKDGQQVIEHWGMRNLRYIEIQNCPFAITADMVEGIAQRQAFDDNDASLESSSALLDDIFEFMKYSIKATNQDMYVDSQARERGRADGDIYINQLTSFGVSGNYTLSHRTNEYALASSSVWSEYNKFIIINAWEEYLHTGNKELLETYYDRLVRNLYLDELTSEEGLYQDDKRSLVDWPAVERDNYDVNNSYYNTVVNAFQYKALLTMVKIAELLGKEADAQAYAAAAANLKQAVNDVFYDVNGNGLYIEGMQEDGTLCTGNAIHATLYPLLFGMVDDAETKAKLGQYLADEGLVGSVYFSQFYLEALYENGQEDTAMEVLTGTGLKSWYHMMNDLNATISCEAWDPSVKPNMTFSHPWGAAAGNIIVRHTFGVQPLAAGFEKIQIKPQFGALEYGTLKTPTIKGSVVVSVQTAPENTRFSMTTTTPANTVARVCIPASGSDVDVVLVDGVAVGAQRDGDFLVLDNVGSGTHTFEVPLQFSGFVMVAPDGTETVEADPVAAWETGNYAYIKLIEKNSAILDLKGLEMMIDLNGCDLTVGGTGKLCAFDSANDTYQSDACGAVTNTGTVELQTDVTANNGNRYIAVTQDDVTTMHRLDMRLSDVTLRTTAAGIYYKAVYNCDDVLSAKVKSYGVVLSLNNMPGADFAAETVMGEINRYTIASEPFKSGAVATSGSVFGIMKTENTASVNISYGEMKIYANAYIALEGAGILVGDTVNPGKTVEDEDFTGVAYSLFDVLKAIDNNWSAYGTDAQTSLKQFYSQWAQYGMNTWAESFENIDA